MEIEEEYEYCPVCYKNHGQAFNGILQLRNPSEEILELLESEIARFHDKKSYCLGKKIVPNGYDYKTSSSQFARHLGKVLQQKSGGEYKETMRLVTRSRQTSKDLYRTTILFRVPDFKKGDIVDYKGKDVKVLNIGTSVYVQDIKTNRKQQAKYQDIKANR